MSNPYQAAGDVSSAQALNPGVRPVSATVFGVLNLVFGILGTCGTVFAVGLLIISSFPELSGPFSEMEGLEQFQNPAFRAYQVINTVVGGVLQILLIVSGIGLLKMRAWGRVTAVWYSIPQILAIFAGAIAHWYFVVQPAMQQTGPAATGVMAGAIGGLVGMFFGLIYPVLLLVFMTRRKFVEALGG